MSFPGLDIFQRGDELILNRYRGSSSRVVIPRVVTEIGVMFGYDSKSLSEIVFEEGSNLKKIGNGVFKESGLKSLRIPKSVEEIDRLCFCECKSLSEIVFEEGSNLKKIGIQAFAESSLKSFRIPKSVEEIGEFCFSGCKSLSEIVFEEESNLKKIGNYTFSGSGLKSLRIPKGVEEICYKCFSRCESLSEIVFEEGSNLKKIGKRAFSLSGLKSLRIPKSVEEICEACFQQCKSLSEIVFEEGSNLKNIGKAAFEWSGLKNLRIPKSQKERLSGLLCASHTRLPDETKIIEVDSEETVAAPEKPLEEMVIDVNKYERIRRIGRGSFGKVFLCKKGDSVIAAKFIDADVERNQESFEREVTNLKSLSHPFIVRLCGFALPSLENDHTFVIATEYISGGSLEAVLVNHPAWFDNTSKIEIICGIALGMSFVHSKDIIHRDLKPANVLLDENHLPRVCDFGSSRLFTGLTATSRPNVTPVYEAPEVYDGEYDKKMDVYSFGVMLYEIVTGKLAFRNMNERQLMKHICLGNREPIPDSVSVFARDLIERCWAQDSDSRPSFDEICVLLKENMHALFQKSNCDRIAAFRTKYFAPVK